MRKGLTFLPALALAAWMALPAPVTAAPHANTVVATVNGEDITLGHMILARESLPAQYKQLPADVLYKAILDQLIQQTALKQELHGEVPHDIQLRLDNETRSLLANQVIETVMTNAVNEDSIRKAYDAAYSTGDGGDEFHAAHILVETVEEAEEVIADLKKGADFGNLAKSRSTGPSGPSGGDLGWFGLGRMVPEFETAVLAMEAGEFSAPVQTQFGWHVILLHERRKTAAPDIEEVRGQLEQQVQQAAIEAHVDQLTGRAEITRPTIEGFDPAILQDLSLVRK